jgi:hypothetical protein
MGFAGTMKRKQHDHATDPTASLATKSPNMAAEKFEAVVKSALASTVMVLVYE